uniref:CDP-alcohol phosphatidyltransferase family protein n=1 Tax=candidate division WOR-3 bacterium TaxID=2052148 RepID=A0A7C4CAC8_UNCW3
MREETKRRGRRLLWPVLALLSRMRVAPTAVTLAALPFSALAGWLFANGRFAWAGAAATLAGLCDSLDGELARMSGRQTATGAFLDSVSDRLSETMVFGGLCWYYHFRGSSFSLLAGLALVLSLAVSYVRARAEGLGRHCAVGWFERPVRVIVLLVGALLLGPALMPWALLVIAAGSAATVVQRFVHVLRQNG